MFVGFPSTTQSLDLVEGGWLSNNPNLRDVIGQIVYEAPCTRVQQESVYSFIGKEEKTTAVSHTGST